jgi:hypothetical protein
MNKLFIKIFNRSSAYDLPIRLDRIRSYKFNEEEFSITYWISPIDGSSFDQEPVEYLFEKEKYEIRKKQLLDLTLFVE